MKEIQLEFTLEIYFVNCSNSPVSAQFGLKCIPDVLRVEELAGNRLYLSRGCWRVEPALHVPAVLSSKGDGSQVHCVTMTTSHAPVQSKQINAGFIYVFETKYVYGSLFLKYF